MHLVGGQHQGKGVHRAHRVAAEGDVEGDAARPRGDLRGKPFLFCVQAAYGFPDIQEARYSQKNHARREQLPRVARLKATTLRATLPGPAKIGWHNKA